MKIYVIALTVMLFSGVVGIYNDLGIFGEKPYNPELTNISKSDVEMFAPTNSGKVSGGIWNDIMGIPGMVVGVLGLVWKLLGNAFNLGGIFSQYIPGVVGTQIGLLVTATTWVIYAWGAIQLYLKVSSKGME